jgi:hypothetical protein
MASSQNVEARTTSRSIASGLRGFAAGAIDHQNAPEGDDGNGVGGPLETLQLARGM